MKNRRLFIGAIAVGVFLIALSFGAKWVIFSTVLEKDESGRQPEMNHKFEREGRQK